MSLGVAVHEPQESATDTLKRDDAAVYTAKRAGRNQIKAAVAQTFPEPANNGR